jgi:phage terminase large subunit-like protein
MTVKDPLLLSDEEIAAMTATELEEYEAILAAEAAVPWGEIARAGQLAPPGEWRVWLVLAGRGWGKTRTGAEWAAEQARRHPGWRIALVGQTFADGRDTMVEGESGLLSVLRESELRRGNQGDAAT